MDEDKKGFKAPGTGVIIAACAVVAVLIIIIGIVISGRKGNGGSGTVAVSEDIVSEDTAVSIDAAIPVTYESLKQNEYPEVNSLVMNYFAAREESDLVSSNSIRGPLSDRESAKIEAKKIYVEEYRNINVYTKPGPYENSYLAFVTYELKLKDWEKTAPGLLALLICSDEKGYYVFTGALEETAANYIKEVSAQDDVVALRDSVEKEYNNILDSDSDFAAYMNSLNELIRNSVGEILARSAISSNEGPTVSSNSENAVSEDAVQESFIVVTNTKVNVRRSDSENADKLGQADEGSSMVCYEQKSNGWSKVDFKGEIGYIKSEFLKVTGDENASNATTQTTEATNNTSAEGSDKIRIKETVKVRTSASTDSEVLGSAFVGEKYTVSIKEKNGWIGIDYKGKTGYVKAEYTE
ncbi:MAG: SH3 domain-containing protein [Lachnospiraceae bacterium]|nr:SH3 domain-containing protein [Lachnospiraceae bacterium]